MRLRVVVLCLASFAGAVPAFARQAEPVAADAVAPASQFYLLSFTDAPIIEVAEAVVGGALAQSLAIDPAVDGTMSFSAEGAFTPDDLLQEFGSATLDQDVALVRSRAGDLALIPRANLAAELARGGALLSLARPERAAVPASAAAVASPIVYGQDRWWEGPVGGLLIFLVGAASGAAALYSGQRILTRSPTKPAAPLLRIAHASPVSTEPLQDDPELTIPRFETHRRDG